MPGTAAADPQRPRVSAARTALRGVRGTAITAVLSQPNPPRSALISRGKHFPGPGLAPCRRSRSRPRLPPPAAPLRWGGSGSSAARTPRGTAGWAPPPPLPPPRGQRCRRQQSLRSALSPHLTPALRSAAAAPQQPRVMETGEGPRCRLSAAAPRHSPRLQAALRPPPLPCHRAAAGRSGRRRRRGKEDREGGKERRGGGGPARPCCVTMRGALPRDRRRGAGAARDPA